jgi:CRP-like cAMP-binding protein
MSESRIFENFGALGLLDKLDLSGLSRRANLKKFGKGKPIFEPKEPQKSVFFLKKGTVKISAFNKVGEELIKAILKPGDMFGKMPFVPGSEINDCAFAVEDCVVCCMPVKEFERALKADRALNAEVIALIGRRVRKLERRLEGLSFRDARSRLIEAILDFNEDYGYKIGEEYFIDQNLSHRELAALIATSRQTVTKVLNELRGKKLIDFDRRKLIIRNFSGLKSEIMYELV